MSAMGWGGHTKGSIFSLFTRFWNSPLCSLRDQVSRSLLLWFGNPKIKIMSEFPNRRSEKQEQLFIQCWLFML